MQQVSPSHSGVQKLSMQERQPLAQSLSLQHWVSGSIQVLDPSSLSQMMLPAGQQVRSKELIREGLTESGLKHSPSQQRLSQACSSTQQTSSST